MDADRFFEGVAANLACDRLTAKEASDVAAQLPVRLRRLWREGERPERPPHKVHAAELIGQVRRSAALPDDREAERAVRGVFRSLRMLLGSPSRGRGLGRVQRAPEGHQISLVGGGRP
jgi:uncharacterized protein (DUF2267 family)